MTPAEAGPYPLVAIRPIIATACLALLGCATDVVTRSEHSELLSSVRALRAENSRLEARLERLEAEKKDSEKKDSEKKVVVSRSAAATTSQPPPRPSASYDALPPLTVVKLKPRKEAPPPIMTNVEISEPSESVTQEIKTDAPDEADM